MPKSRRIRSLSIVPLIFSLCWIGVARAEMEPTEEEIAEGKTERARYYGCLYTAGKVEPQIAEFVEAERKGEEGVSTAQPPEKPQGGHTRTRLERLARRLSVRTGLYYRPEHWRVGFGIRYSRSIEFDPEAQRYALTEVFVCTPELAYGGDIPVGAENLGWSVGAARPVTVVARRLVSAAYSWSKTLFSRPYSFSRLPLSVDKAMKMEPGERVTMTAGSAVFWNLGVGWDIGFFRIGASLGKTYSANYYVEVERPFAGDPSGRDWRLAIGGTIDRAAEFFRVGVRTEEIWIKKFRIGTFALKRFQGERFYLTAGRFDLRKDGATAKQFDSVVRGIGKISDIKLFGEQFQLKLGAHIDFDHLGEYMDLSEFGAFHAVLSAGDNGVPWAASLTGYKGTEIPFRLWFLIYERDWNLEKYDEKTVTMDESGNRSTFYDHTTHRERDRGYILFPRESYDVEITTVQDASTGELFTEATYELRDAHVYDGEAKRYWKRVHRFLSHTVEKRFAIDPPGEFDADVQAIRKSGLPDFDALLDGRRNMSAYLRVILGPSLHKADSKKKTPEKVRVENGRQWHKRVMQEIFGHQNHLENALNERMWETGEVELKDLYVSFRFTFEAHQKEMRKTLPRVLYEGEAGTPEEAVSVYSRLRKLYDQTGSIF